MPTPRVLMSKIRQALQLLAGHPGLSMRQVAAALGVSKTTVSEIAMYARDAGVDWPLASTLSDDELQARLYPPPRPRSTTRARQAQGQVLPFSLPTDTVHPCPAPCASNSLAPCTT
jgi:hypothetical protein